MKRPPQSPSEPMKEALTKASQTSALLINDIRQCYNIANPTEEIIVRGILQQAVEVEKKLHELAEAVRSRKD